MEKFNIKIEKITTIEGKSYPDKETVYEQTFVTSTDLILCNVIKAVNDL
jgi:hypothetical protein